MSLADPLDVEVAVLSAKHLKNVNWRNGDLKPYVVLYLDSDHRLATHSDDSGSTKPVWNERVTLPLTRPLHESVLTIEIFHSKPSDSAKPLVGSVRFPLAHLVDSDEPASPESVRTLNLVRPSGRPQGKMRVKLTIKERPSPIPPPPRPQSQPQDYYTAPPGGYYYSSAPPPPPPPITGPSPARDYREFSPSPYPYPERYYPGYYYPPGPQFPRPIYNRPPYGLPGGPSAPVDSFPPEDHKPLPPPPQVVPRLSSYGVPSGPSAPVDYSPYDHRQLQKGMGGLSLEEDRAAADRAEGDLASKMSYSYAGDYRREC